MRKSLIWILLILLSTAWVKGQDLTTPFERDTTQSATYTEAIAFYQALAAQFPEQLQLREIGPTDSGAPLHLAIVARDGAFYPEAVRMQGKRILFVNNGIHAGEPCGVDASMLFVRELLADTSRGHLLDSTVLLVIPFYNIGGALNRGSYSRANQNGPVAYGFRGNAKNLDLNRDFIKCDSRNARTFNQIFALWSPDVFMDNHTSNGADYPYAMTLIAPQHNKLSPPLAGYLNERMLPWLYEEMEKRGWPMTPYVNTDDLSKGNYGFLDLPRYSTGYAALHHTLGFTPEAHMLKPFAERVRSTYALMDAMLNLLYRDGRRILEARRAALIDVAARDSLPLHWQLDTTGVDSLVFQGYTARYKPSEVSGLDRLYYDRTAPYTQTIPYYNTFKADISIERPAAYIIPQAYQEVIERLRWNGVHMEELTADTTLEVEQYYIRNYETTRYAYEGHYPHSDVEVERVRRSWNFRRGDLLVTTDQPAVRYIMETLEPQAHDSFFAWNFFDGILMRKEYFSSYVFEDLAAAYLREHPEVRAELEQRRQADPEFAKSARAQLNFVYERSPYYEPTHNLYPVTRLLR